MEIAHPAKEKGAEGKMMKGKVTQTLWELGNQQGPTLQNYERATGSGDHGGAGLQQLPTNQRALIEEAADVYLQALKTHKLETKMVRPTGPQKATWTDAFRHKEPAGWKNSDAEKQEKWEPSGKQSWGELGRRSKKEDDNTGRIPDKLLPQPLDNHWTLRENRGGKAIRGLIPIAVRSAGIKATWKMIRGQSAARVLAVWKSRISGELNISTPV